MGGERRKQVVRMQAITSTRKTNAEVAEIAEVAEKEQFLRGLCVISAISAYWITDSRVGWTAQWTGVERCS